MAGACARTPRDRSLRLIFVVLLIGVGLVVGLAPPQALASAVGFGVGPLAQSYNYDAPVAMSTAVTTLPRAGTTPAQTLSVATTSGEVRLDALPGGASDALAAVVAAEGATTVLYHGSPGFAGSEFNLETAIARSRAGTGEPGIYLTDSAARAIQHFAPPGGTVVRTEVPSSFANAIRQLSDGKVEYFIKSQGGVDVLNAGITHVVGPGEALRLWGLGSF